MSIILKQLDNTDEAKKILEQFSSCLHSLSGGKSYRRKMAEKFLEHGIFITAFDGDRYAGFAAFYANDHEGGTAFLSMIAVQPEYRGKRVGYRLLEQCMAKSAECGMKKMRLEVRKDNKAVHFYERNGFRYAGDCSDVSFFMEKIIGRC